MQRARPGRSSPPPCRCNLQEKVPGLIYVDLETDKGASTRDGSLLASADWDDGHAAGHGSGSEQGGAPPAVPA